MVNQYDPISQSVVDALATLASTKLAPNTYEFPPFAATDALGLPVKITNAVTYGTGSFPDNFTVPFVLWSYKTIAGKKTYSYVPVANDFTGQADSGNFSMTWTWVSPTGTTAPDGYIAAVIEEQYNFIWLDIGNVETISQDGAFVGWHNSQSLLDDGAENLPCGNGMWLKVMNRIHNDFWASMSLNGGATPFASDFILSGPWCVSAGEKCYLQLNNVNFYENLKFLYSESDSLVGNQLAVETDFLAFYFNAVGGEPNNLDFSMPGVINGRISFFSSPSGQSLSDWTISTTPTSGITLTFDPNYTDNDQGGRVVTAFFFDLVNVPYVVATPIVFTLNPPGGVNIISDGTGGRLDIVLTGDFSTFTSTDTTIIHFQGSAGKSVALANNVPDTTLSGPHITPTNFASHWRSKVNGVFVANTIPTLGVMPYVDQDLPQYTPKTSFPADTRRTPLNAVLPYIAAVNNRGALWPVFQDTEFIPDSVVGEPVAGSKAWQTAIATKYVTHGQQGANVPPSGVAMHLTTIIGIFINDGTVDYRLLVPPMGLTLYVQKNSPPTIGSFDAMAPSGAWFSLADAIPGFETNTEWFFALLNPTANPISLQATSVVIDDATAPNGTFFPTELSNDRLTTIPAQEGFSFHFFDPLDFTTLFPIPLLGYCVNSITIRRVPVDNGSGIFLSPSSGTSDLNVNVGLMAGFGFETAGTFALLQTFTIPAGQAQVTASVFWPVLSGTPIAFQCSEGVVVRASVNFQPQMHSTFSNTQVLFNGSLETVGYWGGEIWYDFTKAMLFQQTSTNPVVLPISASVVNDLTAVLNLLP